MPPEINYAQLSVAAANGIILPASVIEAIRFHPENLETRAAIPSLSKPKDQTRSRANLEAWRRRKIEAFYRSDYQKAVGIATAALASREEGEDVAGLAFERLMEGRTSIKRFYRKLKDVLVDRIRQREVERRLFAMQGETEPAGDLGGSVRYSIRGQDLRDPALVLMDTRNTQAKRLLVGLAKKSKKMRRARRATWVQAMEIPRPKQPARTDI